MSSFETPSTSAQWFERAKQLIPGGVNSPVRSLKYVGGEPPYFSRGKGPYLWDVEGNRYVDFCLAFGPHLLGHSPRSVVKAIRKQAKRATTFGACHPLEVRAAETILSFFPFLDCVRLVNSGTEACMTAIRVARGATNRAKILKFEGCYHGHSDGLLAKAGSGLKELTESSSRGVPTSVVQDTLIARYDDLSTARVFFEKFPKEIAAVIVEPVPANDGLWVPPPEHIEKLVTMAREYGALVIFDEVISGFRLGPSGASGMYGQEPDLVTVGKIAGGGLPLAALLGKRALMECLAPVGEVYQAGTLSGNPLAAAAGLAALEQLAEERPWQKLDELTHWFANALADNIRASTLPHGGPVVVRQLGSLFWLYFGEDGPQHFPPGLPDSARQRFASFFRHALERGVYLPPSPYEVAFVSTAHTRRILEQTLARL